MPSDSIELKAEEKVESAGPKKEKRRERKPSAAKNGVLLLEANIKGAKAKYDARIIRLKWASALELIIVTLLIIAAFVANSSEFLMTLDPSTPASNLTYLLIQSNLYRINFLFTVSLLFLEVFVMVLTGYSIVVNFIRRRYYADNYLDRVSELTRIEFGKINDEDTDTVSLGSSESLGRGKFEDEIGLRFASFLRRSREAFDQAQRRPNALLLVGTVVAILGLLFFLVTLPGVLIKTTESYGQVPVPSQVAVSAEDISRRLLDLTPRLLMLVFIQLLAGFFLRQYRSSMEEVRYYESILRYRESQFISYLIRKKSEDGSLKEFAQSLLENKDFIKLQQGETTLVLEAQKGEANEFKGVFETFADLLRSRNSTAGTKDGKDS